MSKATVYSAKGTKLEAMTLPKDFNGKVNWPLLTQAIRVFEERSHLGLAKTKTRAEINRTKKKWYRQKGTGGARHGAKSAPIFVGGGVAHGPKPVRRILTLSKKMASKALNSALALKGQNQEVVIVSGLAKITKTKEVALLIKKLSSGKKKNFTFVLSQDNLAAKRAIRNIAGVKIVNYRDLNAFRVFWGGILVFDKEIFAKKK